jgi:hypothetical protein
MNCNFCLFSKKIISKVDVFESLIWGSIPLNFMGFFLRFSNQNMTSITLNTNFHIDLRRFVSDWTCIIQILKYSYLKK